MVRSREGMMEVRKQMLAQMEQKLHESWSSEEDSLFYFHRSEDRIVLSHALFWVMTQPQCLKGRIRKEKLPSVTTFSPCLFENIGADQFLKLFIAFHNSRKRDYWNFFDKRYDSRECFELDREFIDSFRIALRKYLSDESIEACGTRKYCSKILELLNKKVQQFGGDLYQSEERTG